MAKANRGGKRTGASASSVKQVVIDFGSGNTQTYREENGTVYSIGIGNTPDQSYSVDMNTLIANAKKNGYKIQTFTNSQYKRWLANYNKSRQNANDDLNFGWYNRTKTGRIVRPRKGWKGH